jgi:UDP-N-acetylmuramate dehydrogenase
MNMSEPVTALSSASADRLRGVLRTDVSMASHVSWRCGGRARRTYQPADLADLCNFLRTLPSNEPLCFVGLGSNLLLRDGGWLGTVILMHRSSAAIRLEGEQFWADAGAACPKLARHAARESFEGAEFLAGVPGTVGGALAMNAGCYGSETWQSVSKVQTVDRTGRLHWREPVDFDIGYRHVALRASAHAVLGQDEWFVGGYFKFVRGDGERARSRIRQWLEQRVATQPLNLPNAGSVFRNPPGDYAARLIESCGLKGFACGGAMVSTKHANFIVNPEGAASASDIECLIEQVRERVLQQHGITLQTEVRIIGEQPATVGAAR